MSIQIFHNPRCSKSRETLALLKEQNLDIEIVEYLKTVPTSAELTELLTKLGFSSARQLMRVKEADYKENNLAKETDEQVLIQAMLKYPKLIERPIVVNGQKAALGRPPENVLKII
ncbi:arsenate reductase (glutaredoxin) [Algibacillus agarilyticus]|uniref:arsenate reductase (glutaredoxin) n=1 Tax=Algibacillus agarilyticus TaxID=2234133 RepID=UPI000DD005E7|nr:arsenate reductase (glutaredoxin) [Algibacillus agarilyticus]